MPTYDYECRSCGHVFETFQSMSDDALSICPQCDKDSLRRLIGGGSGVIFKGSGFYVNDSRKSSSSADSSSTTKKTSPSTDSSGKKKGKASA